MFEKEAEEYYENVTVGTFQECTENFADAVLTAYKDGAEFGYNKGFEFGAKSNEKVNQIVANEWHYVKDGDLPKENEYIMIYSKLADNIAVGKRRCAGKIRKRCVYEWYFATYEGTYCLRDKDIIAWKEIVPPNIKEEVNENENFS